MNPVSIAVYFSDPSPDGYPFNDKGYLRSYLDFFKLGKALHPELEFFVTRGDSYVGEGKFNNSQQYNVQKNSLAEKKQQISADIIYNKGGLPVASNDTANIINHPAFDRLCKDKMRTALLFPDFFPVSIEAESSQEIQQAAKRIHTEKIVIKPVSGAEGKDVSIHGEKDMQKISEEPKEKMIVQEFLDTEDGIDGVVKSVHDLRVLIMNGEIVQIYVRTPKKDNLIANVAKGGRLKEIDISELPNDIHHIVKIVDREFTQYFPRIYSIDFGYTPSGPKIFELNSQPGLPYPEWKKYYRTWHTKLLETLLSSLNQ